MSSFKLEIQCNNAAFTDEPGFEIARILQRMATKAEFDVHKQTDYEWPLFDTNGNRIGVAQWTHTDESDAN